MPENIELQFSDLIFKVDMAKDTDYNGADYPGAKIICSIDRILDYDHIN